VPALELTSGLLVVALGVRLLPARWRSLRSGHVHLDHQHDDHAHVHDRHHAHEHGDHVHAPAVHALRWRELAAMGVSGGLVPCPEAIGILLVAIGLNRVAPGLGLITASSLGLAIVLCVLGVLLVRARAVWPITLAPSASACSGSCPLAARWWSPCWARACC